MDSLREYTYWARANKERVSRELAQLKGTNDRKKLSELYIAGTMSVFGLNQLVSEDEDIENMDSETSEELAVERAMWETLQELTAVVEAVEAELHQVDDAEELPAEVTRLEDIRRRKAS